MKKLISMIALAAITAGSVYAQQQKPDTVKTKKVKPQSSTGNIRIKGDTTEIRVVKDSAKR